MGFPGGTVVENLFANAGDTGDLGLIPGLGRAPGEGNGNPLSILAWKIPWTEEPGGPQSMGLQTVGHDWPHTPTHTYTKRRQKLSECSFIDWDFDYKPQCRTLHLGWSQWHGVLFSRDERLNHIMCFAICHADLGC